MACAKDFLTVETHGVRFGFTVHIHLNILIVMVV